MKKRKPRIIKDPKKRGEWAESVFMARASERGLQVSRPWGDTSSYDFVVGKPGRFVSVQVKSTMARASAGYVCTVRKQGELYAPGSFDFLAAYVIAEDVWYIVPAARFAGRATLVLCSEAEGARYEEYREAWDLLREASCEAGKPEEPAEAPGEEAKAEARPRPVLTRMMEIEKRMRRFYYGSDSKGAGPPD